MAKLNRSTFRKLALISAIILLDCGYAVTAGFLTDSRHNINETEEEFTSIVRNKISSECESQGIFLPEAALESYSSCFNNTHIPLSFPIKEDLNEAFPGIQNMVDEMLAHWCLDWNRRTECVRKNMHHIETCLSFEKGILMDLNLSFGDALCSEDGGELFNVYMQFIEEGGIQCLTERDDIVEGMMTCINPLNVSRFNRNLFHVTDCIVQQLEQCPTDGPMELLNIMVGFSTRFYESTSTGDRKLFKNDEDGKNDANQNGISQEDHYVEIIPAKAGSIYMYVYIGVAVGICMWLIIAISCLIICDQGRKEIQLKNKGWQKI